MRRRLCGENEINVMTAVGPAKSELKVGLYGDIGSANDNEPHTWRLLAIDKNTGKVIWDKVGHEAVPRVKRHTEGEP